MHQGNQSSLLFLLPFLALSYKADLLIIGTFLFWHFLVVIICILTTQAKSTKMTN